MSPRTGGEADKIGNRYEGSWTVARLLDVLLGNIDWVRIEPLGDLGKGAEFVLKRADGPIEAHQVKRQTANANEWNLGKLARLKVWESARRHVEADRDYHFVSTVPYRPLQELADRTRDSNDWSSFIEGGLPDDLDTLLLDLAIEWKVKADNAYRILRRIYIRLIDESELTHSNKVLAELALEGGPGAQARASLGEVIDNNIDTKLTADAILSALKPYKLNRRLTVNARGLADMVDAESLAWTQRTAMQLIQPVIPRTEADRLRSNVSSQKHLHFLVGSAGGGKTAILQQTVSGLLADDVPTLVLRLDRYGTLLSTTDLGKKLGFDISPVAALAASAGGDKAVLVVDQLDAVSLVSGRLTENFDVVADLVAEARAFPHMHVVLGCRQFDVDNDDRIRGLKNHVDATVLAVDVLSEDQVDAAVESFGLSAATLNQQQRQILRLPLHLTLLAALADEPDALAFVDNQKLFDAYWQHKQRVVAHRRQSTRFSDVAWKLATTISDRQTLSVPASIFDDDDLASDAAVLISEQLLVRDGPKIAFFHEALFDYAFARYWSNRNQSLVEFLTSGEQELFRRGQVRQIVSHLRATDPDRFIDETRDLLTSRKIRFHIKDAAISVLSQLTSPSTTEADMILEVSDDQAELRPRLWSRLRASSWFERFDSDGHIERWLKGAAEQQERALALMTDGGHSTPDRVAEVLAKHADGPAYGQWIRRIARFADLSASRALFDLYIDAITQHHYAGYERYMWLAAHDLGEHSPEWAVEVLDAALVNSADALKVGDDRLVEALKIRDHQGSELVRNSAEHTPRRFCDTLMPYLLRVMEASAYDNDGAFPITDRHFSHRYPGNSSDGNLGDVLFSGMTTALRHLAAESPEKLRPSLELLASSRFDSAQWLLYQAIQAAGATYSHWAVELLLQGPHRLLSGYASNGVWLTRQLIETTLPHISDDLVHRLETSVRDVQFPWEHRGPGWAAFNLLSAFEEARLSDRGRRRLGELRRFFGINQPPDPTPIIVRRVEPPISNDAAEHMSDDNWLRAMAKHSNERETNRPLTGGAREFAEVLRQQTIQDPCRFARLSSRITTELNPAYPSAILMGIGEADAAAPAAEAFTAIRHLISLGHAETDRWLGTALRPYMKVVPLGVFQLVLDRLLSAEDPTDDGVRVWSDEGGVRRPDIRSSGINTARGSLAEALADLLIVDATGKRTALVVPALPQLVQEPSVPVRACIARILGAAMMHGREAATAAFWQLIESDDALLSTEPTIRLIVFLGREHPDSVQSIITRMLKSERPDVQETGGHLAAYSAMEWEISDHLDNVMLQGTVSARKGAAGMAAHRLPTTANSRVASEILTALAHDPIEEVRHEVAEVAGELRNQPLLPFEATLTALIASPAFKYALPPLLITLKQAPDKVDDLSLACSQRFVDVLGAEAADISTGTAADARSVGQLVVRGLTQSRSKTNRAALLDVLDDLLRIGAYGVDNAVAAFER